MVGEDDELLPHTSIGHYEIHRRVGEGGMGDVYAAEHKALGKRVAIKVLRRKFADDEDVVARFVREGKLAGRLRHPNIVDVTDVVVIDGLPCLVMELLEGEPLSDRIERDGAIPVAELADIAVPIVAALEHAHTEGVLHRDLKPGNVFLARGWSGETTPKLLDFGISKSLGDPQTSAALNLTSETGFLGTPRYAPPEIISGGSVSATPKSDQYSMALVLYEASTGVRPFEEAGQSLVNLARAIATGHTKKPRELLPSLPEAFERVIRRAMSVLPEDRYPSMRELGAALLPFTSERIRHIWTPIFAGADPLMTTGETNVGELLSPAKGGEPSLVGVSMPSDDQQGTAIMRSPPVRAPAPSAPSVGGTVVMPRPASPITPRSGQSLHPLGPIPTPQSTPRTLAPIAPAPRVPLAAALIGGIAGLGFVVMVIIVARNADHGTSKGSSSASVSATAPPSGASYDIAVHVVPENALFELDGVAVGSGTMFARSFPRDHKRHVLRISAPAHEPLTVEFDETSAPPSSIVLRPLDGTPPRPPPPGGPQKPGARPGSRTDNINPWE